MDANKNIDQFVKRKLEKRTFEYQDGFWQDAEQMIVADENRRRKKKGFFFWLLGFGICLAGSGFWLQSSELTRSQTKFATNNTTQYTLHNHEHTVLTDSKLLSAKEKTNEQLSNESNPIASDRQDQLNNPLLPLSVDGNSKIIYSNLELERHEKIIQKKEDKPFKKFDTTAHTLLNASLLKKQNNLEGDAIQREYLLAEFKTNRHPFEKKEISIFPIQLSQEDENEIKLPAYIEELETATKKHHWHLMIGGQIANRVATVGEDASTRKIDPLLGILYERAIHPKLGLNTGVLYQPRSGLNMVQSVTSTDYGFGRETITTQLSAQRVHYISVPLYLRIKLKGSHSAIIGLNYSSVFQVSGEKIVKRENSLGEISENKTPIDAVSHNLANSDFSIRAGYEYHIFRSTFLGLQAQYGLNSINQQTNVINQRNIFVQFYLRYRFLSH